MSYYLYLIETKKEYTIHLINELTPLMYEGIQSIYEEAKDNSNDNEELKLFQSLLRKIPSWNEHLIEQETNRIIKNSSKSDIIEDLINAVVKSNIMILTNTPPEKKDNLQIKHDITTMKFIHNSYIEVARNIFQNPYLFYHKLNSFELKKNQRESYDVIKKSIEQAIRKLLPMNVILQNYLGKTFEQNKNDDFENPISQSDYNNLKHMLKKGTETKPSNDDKINIELELPETKKINHSTEHFKQLKELAKNNSPKRIELETKKQSEHRKITSESIMSISDTSKHNKSDSNNNLYLQMKQSYQNRLDKKKNVDSEDASVSYFKQNNNRQEYEEVYGGNQKEKKKQNNSSVDLRAIMDNMSEINNKVNVNNKKKYFSKNNNL